MRVRLCTVGVAVMATSFFLGGCRSERSDRSDASLEMAGFTTRDSTRILGPGDVRIVSTDSSIEIALQGTSIVTGLADKARATVKQELDPTAVKGTGLSAKFERFVKSNVQSVLDKQLVFPVSSVSDVRFEGGNLEFFDRDGKRMAIFGKESGDSSSRSSRFSSGDAQAFIAAFHSRKAVNR